MSKCCFPKFPRVKWNFFYLVPIHDLHIHVVLIIFFSNLYYTGFYARAKLLELQAKWGIVTVHLSVSGVVVCNLPPPPSDPAILWVLPYLYYISSSPDTKCKCVQRYKPTFSVTFYCASAWLHIDKIFSYFFAHAVKHIICIYRKIIFIRYS